MAGMQDLWGMGSPPGAGADTSAGILGWPARPPGADELTAALKAQAGLEGRRYWARMSNEQPHTQTTTSNLFGAPLTYQEPVPGVPTDYSGMLMNEGVALGNQNALGDYDRMQDDARETARGMPLSHWGPTPPTLSPNEEYALARQHSDTLRDTILGVAPPTAAAYGAWNAADLARGIPAQAQAGDWRGLGTSAVGTALGAAGLLPGGGMGARYAAEAARPGAATKLGMLVPLEGEKAQAVLGAAHAGVPNEQIYRDMGAVIGPDGVPRMRIDDRGQPLDFSKVQKGLTVPATEVLPEHKALFDAAPGLQGVSVRGVTTTPRYDPATSTIDLPLPSAGGKKWTQSKLAENLQTALQEQGNMASSARHTGNWHALNAVGDALRGVQPSVTAENMPAFAGYTSYLKDYFEKAKEAWNSGDLSKFPWAGTDYFAPRSPGVGAGIDAALQRGSAGRLEKHMVGQQSLQPPNGPAPYPYMPIPRHVSMEDALVLPTKANMKDPAKLMQFMQMWHDNPYRKALE